MNQPYELISFGPLEGILIPAQTKAENQIVVLHGYGADAFDLAPLSQVLQASPSTQWIFLNGPLTIPIGPHMTGRAWFPIDIEALQLALAQGNHRNLAQSSPPELKQVIQLVEKSIETTGIPLSKTILMGFSQGAMAATAITLSSKSSPQALCILSGALIDQKNWEENIKKYSDSKSGLRFFQSHGRFDPVLSVKGGEDLEKLLLSGGLKGKITLFNGGHEIPAATLFELNQWINSVQKTN